MYCASCGRPVAPGTFCNYCGVKAPDGDHGYAPHAAKPAAKMSTLLWVLVGSLIGGILAVGGLVLGIHLADRPDQVNAARQQAPSTNVREETPKPAAEAPPSRREEPPPPPASYNTSTNTNAPAAPSANYTYNTNLNPYGGSNANAPAGGGLTIVNQTFAVAPGRFSYFQFSVGGDGATVTGIVRASGGRDDIQTLIIPALEMENFKNGHQFRSFYDSGWVTVGNVNVRLPAGDYYLVFSNSRSVVTNKVVTAQVTLHE